ncbi:MAG TPA: pyrroline-5-carboxylate reductase, partial [Gammaproteobacteria bacterium]|nr:pyrroline-5-carboxylate reductase [Gammaproteobacteria bacterium]
FGIETFESNSELAGAVDVVVLAVKPQVLPEVCKEIGPALNDRRPLVVSVAAGIRTADLGRWLGGTPAIVRAMPNTPALVGSGATGLFANNQVDETQRDVAENLMRAVGLTIWVKDETQMDAVTAISGSGPAYLFLVMEALEGAAAELGLSAEQARLLAVQTAFGAAKMALESPEGAAQLRERVTSPGGTTERALQVFEEGELRSLFAKATAAARDRADELARELGERE